MLNGTLALHDIRDTEAYCARLLQQAGLHQHADYEDILAYTIAACWELSLKYRQPSPVSFSTFARIHLRKRLADRARSQYRTRWKFRTHTYERPAPPEHTQLEHAHPIPARDGPDDSLPDLVGLLTPRSRTHPRTHHTPGRPAHDRAA